MSAVKKPLEKYQDFFSLVALGPFCKRFTNIEPKRRLYHNIKGKTTGYKPLEDLHPDDVKELDNGIEKFKKYLESINAK